VNVGDVIIVSCFFACYAHLTPGKLSAVSYDPSTHSRHNVGDRSVKVGHEITLNIPLYSLLSKSYIVLFGITT